MDILQPGPAPAPAPVSVAYTPQQLSAEGSPSSVRPWNFYISLTEIRFTCVFPELQVSNLVCEHNTGSRRKTQHLALKGALPPTSYCSSTLTLYFFPGNLMTFCSASQGFCEEKSKEIMLIECFTYFYSDGLFSRDEWMKRI